jgi:hypothetical protein
VAFRRAGRPECAITEGHRQSSASVDFPDNCLAFQALQSDGCDDRAERGTKENDFMTTFTIDTENNITAFPTPDHAEAAVGAGAQAFNSQQQLAELAATWPAGRLVAIQKLAAVQQTSEATAETAPKPSAEPEKPKATKKAKGGAQAAKGAPAKGKTTKKATPAKNAPKAKKAAKEPEAAGPREGSKTAQVVAMLQRKNGATLPEIMEKMGWLKHTVRGFMAGAMKKAGYTVESFKSDKGERTYKIG